MPNTVTVVLNSNDAQTVYGQAVLSDSTPGQPPGEDLSFPGTPSIIVWMDGPDPKSWRAFAASPSESGTGPNYYQEQDVKFVSEHDVVPSPAPPPA